MAVIGTRLRVAALRLGFRTVFGLPRSVKRLLAGPQVRVEDQGLDLDVQLLYRIGSLLSRREGGALDQATLAEQRRQADLAADISGDLVFDEIRTRDLEVDGAAGPRPARLYEPEAAGTPGPLLVFFHGGGFALGSLTTADPLCRLIAAQAQLRVLSVSYRLAPEHPYPAGLDDALAAFAWVRSHADEVGAVRGLLALGGDSAGANLALVTAHQHPGEAAFVLALYPVTDVAARADRAARSARATGSPPRRWRRWSASTCPTASRTTTPAGRSCARTTCRGCRRCTWHGRVRPAPRRGRGVGRAAAPGRRAGHGAAVPRPGARLRRPVRDQRSRAGRHPRRGERTPCRPRARGDARVVGRALGGGTTSAVHRPSPVTAHPTAAGTRSATGFWPVGTPSWT